MPQRRTHLPNLALSAIPRPPQNPASGASEPIGSGANYRWPAWMRSQGGSGSGESSSSESEYESGEEEEEEEAGSVASEDSFDSACSQQRSCGSSPQPPASAAADAAAPQVTAEAADAGSPAADVVPAGQVGGTGASSSSSSDSEDDYVDAQQGHHGGHSHKHSGGLDDERHSKAACSDPFCALHSGKRFLQVGAALVTADQCWSAGAGRTGWPRWLAAG